jgi:xanthine/CO dehydrogenase XdhC/CoxF family maturation factor
MTAKNLIHSFEKWRATGQALVLASVFETAGSTYSKAGARMLINSDGDFQGMLSGGCLEGDLAARARQVLDSRLPQMVTYDLGLNEDELWGVGVGCDGLMKIFLQPLLPENDYAPFGALVRAYEGDHAEAAVTVLDSADAAIEAGATLITSGDNVDTYGLPDDAASILREEATSALASNTSLTREIQIGERSATVLVALVRPRVRLLALGAGLDVQPLTRLAAELGWRVTVADHRPAYIENGDFELAEEVICCPAEKVGSHVELSKFDACIVMSHHLASDRNYLAQLSRSDIRYVGLLGPKDRRKRLIEELGEDAAALSGRLHGPAGLDIGAVGPAAIALSILAEIYDVVSED